jgi:putative ABC transport system substrate-binding protein
MNIRRREFITLLGGAAAWPVAAHAQQTSGMRRIAVLHNLSGDDAEGQLRLTAFAQGLQQLGWTVGRNLRIDYRWSAGDAERIREAVTELLALAPSVILVAGGRNLAVLQQVDRTIPVVFLSIDDPLSGGFVESLAHPGGNATGFSLSEYGMSGKWLELLKEIAPWVTRAAVLRDPANPSGPGQLGAILAVAPSLGVEVTPLGVRDAGEVERGIITFARSKNGGLIVTSGREQIARIGHRSCWPSSGRHRVHGRERDARRQSFDQHDTHRLYGQCRPSPIRYCREPQPAGRQCHRHQYLERRYLVQAARTSSRALAPCCPIRRALQWQYQEA